MSLLHGFKVLVVEDDPDLRDLIVEDLEAVGATVESCESGNSALQLVKKNQYHFILSDMRMPNGDGRGLATEVQKLPEPKPLFFMYSGYNDISNAEAEALKILQIFPKPFDMNRMISTILRYF